MMAMVNMFASESLTCLLHLFFPSPPLSQGGVVAEWATPEEVSPSGAQPRSFGP